MASTRHEIHWDGDGWRTLFKGDAVRDALMQEAERLAVECDASMRAHLHSRMRSRLAGAKTKLLKNTWIGIVYPKTKAGAAIAHKYGMR
ncbi:MAG: hypothetical protein IJR41_04870 [Atopobiaceae bacterium]|nr:hypothetical protein [Atopobiaceae bacterium]